MQLEITSEAYWKDRPLIYSNLAKARCAQLGISLIDFLPAGARLADTDQNYDGVYAAIYKVVQEDPYFLVLSAEGVVITVFRAQKQEYCRWQRNKSKRRYHQGMGSPRLV